MFHHHSDPHHKGAGPSFVHVHHDQQQQQQPKTTMTPEDRRRYERNLREQQRSQKINQQINELRKVLQESQVPFRQNKYSILTSVVDYITQLQQRSSLLANEHLKLVNTIRQTSEIVNSGFAHTSSTDELPDVGNDTEILYVQGLDYRAVFEQCSFPVAVAALDGRFLSWNPKFLSVTGRSNEELERSTLFGLLDRQNRDQIFRALGSLLRKTCSEEPGSGPLPYRMEGVLVGDGGVEGDSEAIESMVPSFQETTAEAAVQEAPTISVGSDGGVGDLDHDVQQHDGECKIKEHRNVNVAVGYWTSALSHPNEHVQMHITVCRTTDGQPKFFNCSLSCVNSTGYDDLFQD